MIILYEYCKLIALGIQMIIIIMEQISLLSMIRKYKNKDKTHQHKLILPLILFANLKLIYYFLVDRIKSSYLQGINISLLKIVLQILRLMRYKYDRDSEIYKRRVNSIFVVN